MSSRWPSLKIHPPQGDTEPKEGKETAKEDHLAEETWEEDEYQDVNAYWEEEHKDTQSLKRTRTAAVPLSPSKSLSTNLIASMLSSSVRLTGTCSRGGPSLGLSSLPLMHHAPHVRDGERQVRHFYPVQATDGHHHGAAAAKLQLQRREAGGGGTTLTTVSTTTTTTITY